MRSIQRATKDRTTIHGEVVCQWASFTGPNGAKYLQLDTFGSPDRENPGKMSQSFQLDAEGATVLRDLIKQVFGI